VKALFRSLPVTVSRCPVQGVAPSTAYVKRGCRCQTCLAWKQATRGASGVTTPQHRANHPAGPAPRPLPQVASSQPAREPSPVTADAVPVMVGAWGRWACGHEGEVSFSACGQAASVVPCPRCGKPGLVAQLQLGRWCPVEKGLSMAPVPAVSRPVISRRPVGQAREVPRVSRLMLRRGT